MSGRALVAAPLPSELAVAGGLALGLILISVGAVGTVSMNALGAGWPGWPSFVPSPAALARLAQVLGFTAGLTVVAGVLAYIAGLSPLQACAVRRARPAFWAVGAVAAASLLVVHVWVLLAINEAFPIPLRDSLLQVELESGHATGATVLAVVVVSCLTGPLLEELMVRGLMWGLLKRFLPVVGAWLVTSVVFAVLHTHPVQLLLALNAGLLLGLIRWSSGSVLPAVAAHATTNIGAMLVTFDQVGLPRHPAVAVVAAAVLAASVAWLWSRRLR